MNNNNTGIDHSNETDTKTAGGQAEGINFALQSIAQSRKMAKRAKDQLNMADDIHHEAIFIPETRGKHPQLKAHAAILSYYSELCKKPYIQAVDAAEFMEIPYTSARVPELLNEEGKSVVEIEPNEYGEFPDHPDYELETVNISLGTLTWWSMRFITIRKLKTSSYGKDLTETENRKVVLPPRAIDDTYERLDELASRMNILLDIQSQDPHAST